nr:Chain B, GRB2-ASSOCIATED-BINDING PROTEIN 2 [Homo sapiens]
APPPRPPKP